MGGNAIKEVNRLDKETYFATLPVLIDQLHEIFPTSKIEVIKAFNEKESFGDADILIQSDNVPDDWVAKMKWNFELSKTDYVKNGKVFSFRYKPLNFQVDLIMTSSEIFESSYNYFNYNDFSNLIGRMSKKLGFKLGHDGLSYIERDGDYIITDYVFSRNYYEALELLGLDVERYKQGFDNLESIFEYVCSSPYFNPDIYLLHNRNYTSRVRDKKRKTYSEFLKYCEKHYDELHKFPYDRVDDYDGYGSANNTRVEFTRALLEKYPDLHYQALSNRADWVLNQEFKKYFNGNVVKEFIEDSFGVVVEGKKLGIVMKMIKSSGVNTTEKKRETIRNELYEFDLSLGFSDILEEL